MLSKLRSSVDKITVMCRLRAAHLDSAVSTIRFVHISVISVVGRENNTQIVM